MSRVRARIEGTVQGVGFRPYVYRLADELGVAGHVLNDSSGVVVEVEAPSETVERFLARLPSRRRRWRASSGSPPSSSRSSGSGGFSIRESPAGGEPRAAVTPDSATCADCLAELFDPADRRFRYPFTNCTNCGPALHDRARRALRPPAAPRWRRSRCARRAAPSTATRAIAASTRSPTPARTAGRRYASSTPAGGAVEDPAHATPSRPPPARCSRGAIVAVKGIGGFHLACRADDEDAVAELRARKHREDKPFALMAPDLGTARELVDLKPPELSSCSSARGRSCSRGAGPTRPWRDSVAPGSTELGVMLPYSPLHHLLLADAGTTLVMTSGNVSDEPIAYRDEDALRAPRRHRRRVPDPRPPDRDPHRRLGGAPSPSGRPDAAQALARPRAGLDPAAASTAAGICSPAAPS